ncbi:DUF2399 domain-containing protein [Streptomyces sp. CC228A]|uniref:DUF2399 domain-containing protein n=1 Tax=Streptomyces sp. CC228A TaxID=2898186 RepID=UPI0035A8B8C0
MPTAGRDHPIETPVRRPPSRSERQQLLRYSGDLDGSGLRIAEYVARTYGAELIAMDASTVQEAGPEPSSVPLAPALGAGEATVRDALRAGGRVVFQEHDAVLRQVLGKAECWPEAGP